MPARPRLPGTARATACLALALGLPLAPLAAAKTPLAPQAGPPPMSPRTGDFEGGWGLVYITLKYYGFDKAAADFTTDIIEKVHACPFSAADKTDFDRWIAAAQIEVQTSLDEATSHGLPPPAQRLDMQGGDPTRQDTSKLVNQIEQHPETIAAAPCVIGSGPDL